MTNYTSFSIYAYFVFILNENDAEKIIPWTLNKQ